MADASDTSHREISYWYAYTHFVLIRLIMLPLVSYSGNPPASAIMLNSKLGALGMICSFTYRATS